MIKLFICSFMLITLAHTSTHHRGGIDIELDKNINYFLSIDQTNSPIKTNKVKSSEADMTYNPLSDCKLLYTKSGNLRIINKDPLQDEEMPGPPNTPVKIGNNKI